MGKLHTLSPLCPLQVELGLTTPDKPFDTYPKDDWEPDLLIYHQC